VPSLGVEVITDLVSCTVRQVDGEVEERTEREREERKVRDCQVNLKTV
jgi:hypothetical protein